MTEKKILDPCCGSRMFWFDKNDNEVVYTDNRKFESKKIWKSTKK